MRWQQGFTLVELIAVILLIAIVAIPSFRFIGFGSQIYSDAVARDEQVSQARFLIERLTREFETALPASIRISSDGHCIEYVPIIASSIYTQISLRGRDVPFEAISPLSYTYTAGDKIAVSTRTELDVYARTNYIKRIDVNAPTPVQVGVPAPGYSTFAINADDGVSFQRESLARRFQIVRSPISWCLDSEGRLYRFVDYPLLATQPNLSRFATLDSADYNQQLMAKEIRNDILVPAEQPFRLFTTDVRRTELTITLKVGSNRTDEILTMHHGVPIVNLP